MAPATMRRETVTACLPVVCKQNGVKRIFKVKSKTEGRAMFELFDSPDNKAAQFLAAEVYAEWAAKAGHVWCYELAVATDEAVKAAAKHWCGMFMEAYYEAFKAGVLQLP